MFKKKGLITVNTKDADENQLMDIALGAGADDIQISGDVYEITCETHAFEQLKKALTENKIPIGVSEISMIPQTTVPVTDAEVARKILNLMEAFEDHDDVQNVYANFDIPQDILDKLG